MKRNPMRVFAWLLVALGAVVIALTIPFVSAHNSYEFQMAKNMAAFGKYHKPGYAGYGTGFATGAFIAGFGVLLLAIRRPTPRIPPAADEPGALATRMRKLVRQVLGDDSAEAETSVPPVPAPDQTVSRTKLGTLGKREQERLRETLDKFREGHSRRPPGPGGA